jgi:hypothetical protein
MQQIHQTDEKFVSVSAALLSIALNIALTYHTTCVCLSQTTTNHFAAWHLSQHMFYDHTFSDSCASQQIAEVNLNATFESNGLS